MDLMTSMLSDADFDASLQEILDFKKFTYDVSRSYVGEKGVLALLPVLKVEPRGAFSGFRGIRGFNF